ncbi:MAG TPA: hypothetical protein VGO47_02365 [Chlamydiales bacterium]|nr:hypothetical protein [Chlamydiales bacterium]
MLNDTPSAGRASSCYRMGEKELQAVRVAEHIEKARKRAQQPKSKGARDLTRQQRQERSLLAADRQKKLWDDIRAEWARQDAVCKELADKHGVKVEYVRKSMLHLPKYGQQRGVSAYNAFIHAKSLEVNEG